MPDVTAASIDEMEAIYGGILRRARATLGVSSFGMQVITLPPRMNGYPEHQHDEGADDANQEEVYIPVLGSGTLTADGETYDLQPGMMIRVGPRQKRKLVAGERGMRLIALGGVPGTFVASDWTQLEGPWPTSDPLPQA